MGCKRKGIPGTYRSCFFGSIAGSDFTVASGYDIIGTSG